MIHVVIIVINEVSVSMTANGCNLSIRRPLDQGGPLWILFSFLDHLSLFDFLVEIFVDVGNVWVVMVGFGTLLAGNRAIYLST